MSITEFHLSKTDFNTPRVSTGAEAIAVLIVRLILLEPGTIQSHPKMGVGLVSNYRNRISNSDDNAIMSLISDIEYQIDTFLPIATGVKLKGNLANNKQLSIYIDIDGSLYRAVFKDDGSTMKWISLDSLKENY